MKIGILFTAYNCEEYLNDCLDPWFELKNEGYDIIFAASSGMFADYIKLGIPFRNKKTLKILSKYDIDFLITTKGKNLLKENESRNLCIDYLNKQSCDLFWVMDGDEVYTKKQILHILEFINNNKQIDWYSVIFKNFTLHGHLFGDYVHERIVWNRYGGISHYYFDNEFTYKDGTGFKHKIGLEIPRSVAYVNHYAWLSDDIRVKDKIEYHKYRYYGPDDVTPIACKCGYRWNTTTDSLEHNTLHFTYQNVEIPALIEELTCYSTDFTMYFSRKKNTIEIIKVQRDMNLRFEIYNGQTGDFIYQTDIKLEKHINYFIRPSDENFDQLPDFDCLIVKAYENDKLITNIKFHLKFKKIKS